MRQNWTRNSTRRLWIMLLILPPLMGCQFMQSLQLARIPTASPEHPVVEIRAAWEPADGTGLNGLPCRGFRGRITFHAYEEPLPVRVKGSVRISVYDDRGAPTEQLQPVSKFDFDQESFEKCLTESDRGAIYEIFIPYTREDTYQANCTLRVRLVPEDGNRVYSRNVTVQLPGPPPPPKATVAHNEQQPPANPVEEDGNSSPQEVEAPADEPDDETSNLVPNTDQGETSSEARPEPTEMSPSSASTSEEIRRPRHELTPVAEIPLQGASPVTATPPVDEPARFSLSNPPPSSNPPALQESQDGLQWVPLDDPAPRSQPW